MKRSPMWQKGYIYRDLSAEWPGCIYRAVSVMMTPDDGVSVTWRRGRKKKANIFLGLGRFWEHGKKFTGEPLKAALGGLRQAST